MKRLKGLPASPNHSETNGFTKIEVLVTMAVMVILVTFARPGFTKLFPDYQLKAAARDLYSNIQFAKAKAIRDRVESAIVFRPGINAYEVWSTGTNGVWDGYAEPNDVRIKSVNLDQYGDGCRYGPGGATRKVGKNEPIADCISFPGDRVIFNSRGMTTGTFGGYVYLSNQRNTCFAVGTWSSGLAVIRKWSGTAWQ